MLQKTLETRRQQIKGKQKSIKAIKILVQLNVVLLLLFLLLLISSIILQRIVWKISINLVV